MSSTARSRAGALDSLELKRAVAWGIGLVYGQLLVRTAWVCDDAYITFRTVDNFLNGFGLRWNIANRVQAYTHPLWMFVMAGASAITHDVYYTSIVVSIALSLAVVVLVAMRMASGLPMAITAASILALSTSFVEYSTSGLENALTHLLLVGFFLRCWSTGRPERHRLFGLSLLSALLMLNRLDAGLLVLPSLAVAWWRAGARLSWFNVALGMLPLVVWEGFSLIYYGFPFPNTAYAKLAHSVPRADLLHQGFLYVLDAVSNDPITPLVIGGALLSSFFMPAGWSIPSGVLLYLAYIVWVGGDFMRGRMLAAPLLCSVIHLSRFPVPQSNVGWALALAVVWGAGLSSPRPALFTDGTFGSDIVPDQAITATHINDDRRYYYPSTGLLTARLHGSMPDHRWFHLGELARKGNTRVARTDAAGFIGYAAGPGVHYVDRWGLGDPLLARLPADALWEVGHFTRTIPDGYLETIESGQNVIRDAGVRAYYAKLRIVTEGPIWSRERFSTIARLNLGGYNGLIARYGIVAVSLSSVSVPRDDGTDWNSPDNIITNRAIEVRLPEVRSADRIEVSVSRNDNYRLTFLSQGRKTAERYLQGLPVRISDRLTADGDPEIVVGDGSLITRVVVVPADAVFDSILVQPSAGDGRYSLGHLRVVR